MKNMKFYIEVSEMVSFLDVIGVIGNQEDAILDIAFGTVNVGKDILNAATVVASSEQVNTVFVCKRPELSDEELARQGEHKMLIHAVFKAKEFLNIAYSICSLKERLYVEIGSASAYIGVDNNARLPIGILSEDKVPSKVVMKKDALIMSMQVAVPSMVEAFRLGGSAALADSSEARGLGNVVLSVQCAEVDSVISQIRTLKGEFATEDVEQFTEKLAENISLPESPALSGKAKIYSSNGFTICRGTCPVSLVNDLDIFINQEAYLAKKEFSKFTAAIPRKALSNFMKLVAGFESVVFAFTENHVFVVIGKKTMYIFTQGAKACSIVYKADEWEAAPKCVRFVVDADALKSRIDLLNKVTGIVSGDKTPICFEIKQDTDLVINIAGASDKGSVRIKPIAMEVSQDIEVYFSGELMADILGKLKKGNLCISGMVPPKGRNVTALPFEFSNGDLKGAVENSGIAFLVPKESKKNKEASETKEDSTDMETE